MFRAIALAGMMLSRAHAEPPRDLAVRPITLRAGQIGADLVLGVNFDKAIEGYPVSLSPDIWLGLPHAITIGAIHSDPSVDRIGAGSSICIRRSNATCSRAYHNAGLDLRIAVFDRDGLAIAPRARLLVRDVDPWKPAVTAGALVRWTRGRFAVTGDPYLRIGLANTRRGNRAALVVPLYLALQPARRWELAVHTGYDADLAVAADGYHIPVALRVRVAATPELDLGVEAGLRSAFGAQNSSGYKAVLITLGFRSGT